MKPAITTQGLGLRLIRTAMRDRLGQARNHCIGLCTGPILAITSADEWTHSTPVRVEILSQLPVVFRSQLELPFPSTSSSRRTGVFCSVRKSTSCNCSIWFGMHPRRALIRLAGTARRQLVPIPNTKSFPRRACLRLSSLPLTLSCSDDGGSSVRAG